MVVISSKELGEEVSVLGRGNKFWQEWVRHCLALWSVFLHLKGENTKLIFIEQGIWSSPNHECII